MADAPRPVRSEALEGVRHGFMTREGGVSSGAVASLQCGFGADDDLAAVAENRRRASEAVLPGGALVTPYQVHSPDCVPVSEAFQDNERPRADAVVTDRPGLVLGIVTADCAPVLLADKSAGVIGAAHAGWRGAHGGVLENTVAAMVRLGAQAERIVAAIGPCIAQPSYEVSGEFQHAFGPEDARHFSAGRAGHLQFDLPGYVASRLHGAGVAAVDDLALDTYGDPARFYSYRRATHEGAPTYGRQLSLIALG